MAQSFAVLVGIMGGFLFSRLITLDVTISDMLFNKNTTKKLNEKIPGIQTPETDVLEKSIEEQYRLIKKFEPVKLRNGFFIFSYFLLFGVFCPLIILANPSLMVYIFVKNILILLNAIGIFILLFYLNSYLCNIFKTK